MKAKNNKRKITYRNLPLILVIYIQQEYFSPENISNIKNILIKNFDSEVKIFFFPTEGESKVELVTPSSILSVKLIKQIQQKVDTFLSNS